jgi:signal transduction histidine kinase
LVNWSLRSQVVGLVGLVLLVAMGVYAFLAGRFIRADKEATVYDTTALVAGTVAEQLEHAVDGIAAKLRYFGEEYETTPGDAERRARSLLLSDGAVLSLEVYKRAGAGFERSFLFVDQPRLAALNLSPDDLAEARKRTPLPVDAVARSGLLVQNSSLAPDLALVRVATSTAGGEVVISADLRPEWLLSAVSTSRVYKVFLVDALGRVLAHPDASKVIGHADLSRHPAVRNALEAKVARGASEYDAEGQVHLSAWARVGAGLGEVVVEVPQAEVLRAANELFFRSLFFAVGALGLALVLAVFLGRWVSRPLQHLETAMGAISRGEFGAEAPVAGPSEIRSVGAALNSMSRELVRRSEELQRANAQLVQSEKLSAVGELAASVVHEVKNPMVGIVGFAQLAQESTDPKEVAEYLRLIEEDAFRANRILQGLLEFARPPEVERVKLAVSEVVDGTLQLCRHTLQMGGVKVEASLPEGLPSIHGNSNQLRQVLLNLMLNAGQAMERSQVRRLVVSAQGTDEGGVELRISDTGPGIAPEVKDKLFRPFITTKRPGQGTGLGLSVSRSIVEAHGGSIRAESEVGKGATFVVKLPRAA